MSTRGIHRGKYRLIAEIGRGGMAVVYLALLQGDLGFNKLVVLKQIREDMVDEQPANPAGAIGWVKEAISNGRYIIDGHYSSGASPCSGCLGGLS